MRPTILPLFLLALCACFSAGAQSPPGINYQGVARDLEGKPLVLRDISIRISILRDGEDGQAEYIETHAAKTNSFGLFTLVIGKGEPVAGDFRFISWAVGTKWMKVDMDPQGGSDYKPMGAQSFMSVPYAFYSLYSGNGLTAGPGVSINNSVISNTGDADNNPLNEVNTAVTLGNDRRLRITDGGGTKEVDLTPLASQQQLSGVLQLGNDAGNNRIVNLGAPVAPADAATKNYVDSQSDNQALSLATTGDDRTISITNGGAVTFSVADADHSTTNELQDLSLVGNQLLLTGDVTGVNLSLYLDNTDSQSLAMGASVGNNRTINIANGTGVTFSVADGDADATNEIQHLELASNSLTISGDAAMIDLSPYLDNTDSQGLSAGASSGVNRTINITNGTSVTFSVADNDNDTSNELQDLSLSGNTLSLSGDGTTVSLSGFLDNTDNQILSSTSVGTNRNIAISNGNVVTFSVADNDNDATNEMQDLSLSGNTLFLSGDGTAVNLAPFMDNTDSQNLSMGLPSGNTRSINITGGIGVSFSVADDDSSITNEIQDLNLSGNTLSITNAASSTPINLAPYLDNTDSQILNYNGTTKVLGISGGNTVTLPETQTLSQVLTLGADAGAQRITNVATPTVAGDAATKQYVDNINTTLTSAINTTFAFKATYTYVNSSGLAQNDFTIPFASETFDDFSVFAGSTFTAPQNGVYVFVVDGAVTGLLGTQQLSFLFAGVKYPVAMASRYNCTQMFRMNAGQTVTLVGDGIIITGGFNGSFFGYKL